MDLITIQTFGIIMIGIGYVYTKWREGGGRASVEVLKYYKEQVDIQAKQISDLTADVGHLKGQLEEKDKRIDLLTSIAENRNPEMTAFMTLVTKAISDSNKYMTDTGLILKNLEEVIQKLEPSFAKIANQE